MSQASSWPVTITVVPTADGRPPGPWRTPRAGCSSRTDPSAFLYSCSSSWNSSSSRPARPDRRSRASAAGPPPVGAGPRRSARRGSPRKLAVCALSSSSLRRALAGPRARGSRQRSAPSVLAVADVAGPEDFGIGCLQYRHASRYRPVRRDVTATESGTQYRIDRPWPDPLAGSPWMKCRGGARRRPGRPVPAGAASPARTKTTTSGQRPDPGRLAPRREQGRGVATDARAQRRPAGNRSP